MVTKRHRSRNYPSPEYCILDMVNAHLKMNREGRKLTRGVLVCDIHAEDKLLLNKFLGFTHVTNSLATVTIRHLGVPRA